MRMQIQEGKWKRIRIHSPACKAIIHLVCTVFLSHFLPVWGGKTPPRRIFNLWLWKSIWAPHTAGWVLRIWLFLFFRDCVPWIRQVAGHPEWFQVGREGTPPLINHEKTYFLKSHSWFLQRKKHWLFFMSHNFPGSPSLTSPSRWTLARATSSRSRTSFLLAG